MTLATVRGSLTSWSSIHHTPSSQRSLAAAAWAASRVFPDPPAPVMVTSRSRPNSSSTAASSASRPTNVVSSTGRLLAMRFSERSGGEGASSPTARNSYTRSGTERSRRRWIPRSHSSADARGSDAICSAASDDTSTWPGLATARRYSARREDVPVCTAIRSSGACSCRFSAAAAAWTARANSSGPSSVTTNVLVDTATRNAVCQPSARAEVRSATWPMSRTSRSEIVDTARDSPQFTKEQDR